MDYAIIFPGQGAQVVGMGRDFYDTYPVAKNIFDEADKALGFSLSDVIFEGPEEALMKTSNTQPAIMTVSIATLAVLEERMGHKLEPKCVAGHSLGEYTALVAAGVLPFADAVRLVHKRGQWMQEAVPVGVGAMAAVMGLDIQTLSEVCEAASEGESRCQPANVNAPSQIVISGHADAVARAGEIAKERGASKVIPLKVSAPFHSDLMRPVAQELETFFDSLNWEQARVPIVANVDAKARTDASEIRKALCAQTYSPVLWVEDVLKMEALGVEAFLEIGPGNTLCGLIKRTIKNKNLFPVNKCADLEKAMGILGGIDHE